ncbi:MAG: RNA polymerase factor sigma-54 [Phycisphaeraceae bacterium]|nr:RNA polymerase factor sigma-54 [Phycisphaeraceae bacterium]
MRLDTGQHQKLLQDLRISPQQIQAMRILELPLTELEEHIQRELEQNVALEIVEHRARAKREESDGKATDIGRKELVVGGEGDGSDDFRRLGALESSYAEAFENEYSSTRARRHDRGERDGKMDAMANVAGRGPSLAEVLETQWRFVEADDDTRRAGSLIIQFIGPDGLLTDGLDAILEHAQRLPGPAPSAEDLERALRLLQAHLEPAGIAARSHVECLLLQIDHHREEDEERAESWSIVRRIVADHMDDLIHNRLPAISEATGLPIGRIQEAREFMGRLTLSPARDLVDETVRPIIPDAIIEYDDVNDCYVARLRNDRLPSLRVRPRYETMAADRTEDRTTREFISKHVLSARGLIDAIEQRKRTLLRVVDVVIARQREFFDEGSQYLRQLTMTEVADQLGLSVGTISRAVSDKWLETPRGLMPLRRFFSGGIGTEAGDGVAWEAIRATLREIIDAEDKTDPLSDDALARELARRGMPIARRTVVKYREQLGIPKKTLRRQFTDG